MRTVPPFSSRPKRISSVNGSRTPVRMGRASGRVPEIGRMVDGYYAVRGLDADGRPTRETLEKAGLASLADRLLG